VKRFVERIAQHCKVVVQLTEKNPLPEAIATLKG
jgi:hypothetical protein